MAKLKHVDFEVPEWGELAAGPQTKKGYRGEILADNPLMYLRLGESSGPTAFDEMGQHDATVSGTLLWGTPGAIALDSNTAVDGAGAGGLIVNSTGWLPTGSAARTIELWAKPKTTTLGFRGFVYGQSTPNGYMCHAMVTASEISVAVTGCRFGVSGLSLANTWHHVVWVYPSGATRTDQFLMYLDGQLQAPVVLAGTGAVIVNTADSALHLNKAMVLLFNVLEFDEVAVYGHALAADRISAHYARGIAS